MDKEFKEKKLTLEDARRLPDEELLKMVRKAKGHTGKDFKKYFNCDFCYTSLTGLLKERGYEQGWYKPNKTCTETYVKPKSFILKKADGDCTRYNAEISVSVLKAWKEFTKDLCYKRTALDTALTFFMDEAKAGRIKFEIKFE